uniref:GH13992p (inferred by orthology to a D. melanogaster protein) n=1 Tax=Strongyloides venezuelensis TaxID=75913 RepID=A0A0K0G4Q8_STRVS
MLRNIFGSNKKKEEPSPQEAIQKLREMEEMLIKKQEHLEKQVDDQLNIARQYGTKNKRLALQALKKKKQYEKQLVQIDGTLNTLDFQRQALENANTNANILQVLGGAAKALKKAHNDMDIDQVHDLLEDVAEQNEIANEISDAISNPVGFRNEIDESELMAELEELEQEELEKTLADVNPDIGDKLPSVPSHEIPAKQQKRIEVDADLDDLRAWAES